MFKDVLGGANLTGFATWGLVIFVAVFLGVAIWVFTRPRRQVREWANLPLADDTRAEPRERCGGKCECGRKDAVKDE